MQTVTIITDWGSNNFYLPILKGKFHSMPFVRSDSSFSLVELTSHIKPFDIYTMCFIIKNSFQSFPKGTLHLLGVSGEPDSNSMMVLAKYKEHYFLGVDDGRFSLIFDSEDYIFKKMPVPDKYSTFMFPFYATKAMEILYENSFDLLEELTVKKLVKEMPVVSRTSVVGKVVFIDSYGNAITNITYKLFGKALMSAIEMLGEDIGVEMCVRGPYIKLNDICERYDDVGQGQHLALFNSRGYLEFAINKGNFASAEDVDVNAEVTILFK